MTEQVATQTDAPTPTRKEYTLTEKAFIDPQTYHMYIGSEQLVELDDWYTNYVPKLEQAGITDWSDYCILPDQVEYYIVRRIRRITRSIDLLEVDLEDDLHNGEYKRIDTFLGTLRFEMAQLEKFAAYLKIITAA